MALHPLAGAPAPADLLIDPPALERAYYERRPNAADARQRVAFGTSGHRGSALASSFNEAHILAIVQAICDYRRAKAIGGPLFTVAWVVEGATRDGYNPLRHPISSLALFTSYSLLLSPSDCPPRALFSLGASPKGGGRIVLLPFVRTPQSTNIELFHF